MVIDQRDSAAAGLRVDLYTKIVLTAIALLLGVLVMQNAMSPAPVQAQSNGAGAPSLYIEPGLTSMRNPDGPSETQGKLVIDLSTGNVWGFPIVFTSSNKTPVSKPIYLGQYDFSAMKRVP
jgi:hypothetical protein